MIEQLNTTVSNQFPEIEGGKEGHVSLFILYTCIVVVPVECSTQPEEAVESTMVYGIQSTAQRRRMLSFPLLLIYLSIIHSV